jgi:hypothetical protein
MADQNQNDMKKKATIGGFVVVLAIIAWLAKGVFMDEGTAPIPKPVANTPANTGMPNAGAAPIAANPVVQAPRQMPVASNAELIKLQKETEAKYLSALNDLQMLKVQREIAETNQAIASSKLATIAAEKDMTDLLTVKPAPIPEGAYANMLGGGMMGGGNMGGPPTGQPGGGPGVPPGGGKRPQRPAAATATPSVPYVVLSVSQQNDKWEAVLGNSGKLYSVKIGDVLAADGSTVDSISKEGVVLAKDGKKRTITITSAI